MTDTLSLLFDLQKKIDHIKVQIESLKKNANNSTNNELNSSINELKNDISLLATNAQLEERYNDLVEYILNGSSLLECDEILELVNNLKTKIETDHQEFVLSFKDLESINSNIDTINENVTQIKSYYEIIIRHLGELDVQVEDTYFKLDLESTKNATKFSEIETTLTSVWNSTNQINEVLNDINTVYSAATEILRKADTILTNQQTILDKLDSSSNEDNSSQDSTCCTEVNSQLNTINNKVDLILTALNVDYVPDEGGSSGGESGGNEYIEPDTTEELTNSTKINDFNYYYGTPTSTSHKQYFKCNTGSMLVICYEAFLGGPYESDYTVEFYLNDTLCQTNTYSGMKREKVTLSYVTTSTQTLNSVYLKITNHTSTINSLINTIYYTIYAKNAEAISGDDVYQIFPEYSTYCITKNDRDYCKYAICDISAPFDENTLTYTDITKHPGRYTYILSGIKNSSYNVRGEGERVILSPIRFAKEFAHCDKNNSTIAIIPNVNVTDVTSCTINTNYFLIAMLNDNIASIKGYLTNKSTELTYLQGTPNNIAFDTEETPLKVSLVKMTTSPTINAYNPSVIMTSINGNNFFNHNCSASGSNKILPLGYGTNVKACYLNDALNIGVFMKVHGTYILKVLCPNRLTQYSTGMNVMYVNYYSLDEKVYEIGIYDEIHPGLGGEYFAIKDGKIQKLKLPDEIIKEKSYTFSN